MKIYLLAAALICAFSSAAPAQDCAASTAADACAAGAKSSSPFVQASLRQGLPKLPETARAKKAVMKQAPPPEKPAEAPPATPAPPAAPPAPAPEAGISNPLWLIFIGGLLAGLYFYLAGGRAKKARK